MDVGSADLSLGFSWEGNDISFKKTLEKYMVKCCSDVTMIVMVVCLLRFEKYMYMWIRQVVEIWENNDSNCMILGDRKVRTKIEKYKQILWIWKRKLIKFCI